jgi:hypothetical protein
MDDEIASLKSPTGSDRVDTLSEFSPSFYMSTQNQISVVAPADFHVHLRQGDLCSLVTPHIREGGFSLVYVMVKKQML